VWYGAKNSTAPADVVAADEDGIVVVRHAFNHVAQSSPR
jgi:regulator of RNase E activity RraA